MSDIKTGVKAGRKVLGWLTDSKLKLPGWLRRILNLGRKVGAWEIGYGPTGGNLEGPR